GFRLIVDVGLVVFDVVGFALGQLAGMNALIDAVLLAILTRVHAHTLRVRRRSMVDRRVVAAIHAGVVLVHALVRATALLGRGVRRGAARSVEAVVIVNHGPVVDDRAVLVHVVETTTGVPHRGVVREHSAAPFAADEA